MSVENSHYKTPDKLQARKALYGYVTDGGNRWKQMVKEAVNGFEGMVILDAGCGSGDMLLFVVDGIKNLRGIGVDLSEGMIADAKQRAIQAGRSDIDFRVGDINDVSLEETFDRLLVLHVLHVVDDSKKTIHRLISFLKPGGRAVVSLHSTKDMPQLRSWNEWFASETGSTYRADRERFTIENDAGFLDDVPGTISKQNIDHTIRLTNPQPFIDYINTTRDRWEPAITDEQWSAFLEHIRNEITTEISKNGFFDEHSITGLITIDV